MTRRNQALEMVRLLVLSALAVVFLYPFVLMIGISLDVNANFGLSFPPRIVPEEFGWKNFSLIFKSLPIGTYYLNSLIIVAGSVAGHIAGATLAGYALAKGEFRGKKIWLLLILTAMMVPDQVIVFTRFLVFNQLHLINSFVGVILPTLAYPFGVFLVKQFMDSLPNELGEAAKMDGAHHFKIFMRIYLPLTAPIIATLSIITVMHKWNELLWPLLMLSKSSMFTVSIGVANFTLGPNGTYIGSSLALATLTIIPMVVLFLILQRYVIESVASSGLKL
ncbi:carbohydrate ABC transporter permease [Paenibacillus sp. GCM10023248]|uniref:carbohydrate ABC transporter permease n=1 Tax=Bacillales TaxID=1385 RepID=UPI002378E266|nr:MULTISPECIES: carbohydrate ABC transporter permease [Bacillales]MDD9269375.1 carbohydrate ABC transporter permease [Paenibacillus sp. MAHUQ-63]MDR6881005.1 multiple sugar transport system permease protein [Bacillus sp. 3255]